MLSNLKLNAKDLIINYKKRLSRDNFLRKLIMCRKCCSFYYKNSWHFKIPKDLHKNPEEKIEVLFTQCRDCRMEGNIFSQNRIKAWFNNQAM